jgi:hypothetical protein
LNKGFNHTFSSQLYQQENSKNTKLTVPESKPEYGTQRFDNGGYYEGYLKDGKLHGTGTLYYSNGKPAYEGQWFNDKFEG